jgi:hypothetical protein
MTTGMELCMRMGPTIGEALCLEVMRDWQKAVVRQLVAYNRDCERRARVRRMNWRGRHLRRHAR